MQYNLYFRNIKIGMVVEASSNFPKLSGSIIYDTSFTHSPDEDRKRLSLFIDLNRESMRLIDVSHEQEISSKLDSINKQLEAYSDYIETDDWVLIADNGKVYPILSPIFCADKEIVWRWNLNKI